MRKAPAMRGLASVSSLASGDLAVPGGLYGGLEDRRELAAWAAPRGPEVDHHGQLTRALDDVLLEGWPRTCRRSRL